MLKYGYGTNWRKILMARPGNKKVIFRSSVDGKFVTEKYAKKHPRTTEREHVDIGRQNKHKK
jgi:hypothetical protein